ncbi:CIC11C00000005725 [Sungouiella intermedia]|uniref:CIC11C00000001452 n=1 Tax=Sungouiella intermedia TaxID=45354 RepID=A0A1L0BZH9_9ASCO|nr:CIC11C00000005725 [[Candida] intermedia]SGZ56729.1 CIC11C00000001452 [[Candida] intermedia]
MEEFTKSAELYVNEAGKSPLPAWALSASLLLQGLNAHSAVDAKLGSTGGSSHFSKQLALAKPSRTSCFAFGAANALGGWIIFDGDVANGSGFSFAWSVLYLLVNGRPAVRSLFSGRVSPIALGTLALGNATIYGKQFFWPSSKLLPQ